MERRKSLRNGNERRGHLRNLRISDYLGNRIKKIYNKMSSDDLRLLKSRANKSYTEAENPDYYAMSELASYIYISRILKERKKTGYEPTNPRKTLIDGKKTTTIMT